MKAPVDGGGADGRGVVALPCPFAAPFLALPPAALTDPARQVSVDTGDGRPLLFELASVHSCWCCVVPRTKPYFLCASSSHPFSCPDRVPAAVGLPLVQRLPHEGWTPKTPRGGTPKGGC